MCDTGEILNTLNRIAAHGSIPGTHALDEIATLLGDMPDWTDNPLELLSEISDIIHNTGRADPNNWVTHEPYSVALDDFYQRSTP